MTRTWISLMVVVAAAPPTVAAQPSEEQHVLAAVHRLFEGMRQRDGDIVRSVFHPNAQIISLRGDTVRNAGIDDFATAVGASQEEQWNEPIWDTEVRIDGNLASVWTRYAFFRGPAGDQFSHCGFDAFLLHRGAGGWRISVLTDTRRTEGCAMPPGTDESPR